MPSDPSLFPPDQPAVAPAPGGGQRARSAGALTLGAIGLVFGDIGTSPLYAMRQAFAGPHPLPPVQPNVLGIVSLIFWSLLVVVTLKYVVVMMRADNRGEGGILALQALVGHAADGGTRMAARIATLGIFAAALFYGESMVTPAISVLSAVDGIRVVAPGWLNYIMPGALAVLVVLFMAQRQGFSAIGAIAGPVMIVWFLVLAVLGVHNIAADPSVLWALSPHHAILFLFRGGWTAFMTLGAVVLTVAGCEVIYAEMGLFGRLPIRIAWYGLALPSLVLNYFGQGALLLANPQSVVNPFFLLAPAWAGPALLGLAILAAAIASQAMISGAFAMTRQAIQLGYLPRMEISHISEKEMGRIYIPFINWTLMVGALTLVAGFQTAAGLASAYGVAVTATMLISSMLLALAMTRLWGWRGRKTTMLLGLFLAVDGAFFLANIAKIPYGGWFPLAVGGVTFVLLTTWKNGRRMLMERLGRDAIPVDDFIAGLSDRVTQVPGIAMFLTGTRQGIPLALLHNLKHNKVIHERVVICTVSIEEVPVVDPEQRIESEMLSERFQRLTLRFGFMEDPNIPKVLAQARTDQLGFFYEPMSISYFLSRETLVPAKRPALRAWREHLFAWMSRSATSAMDFFQLPSNRVVELGSQIEI